MRIDFELANENDTNKIINVQNQSFYEDYVKYGECPAYNESEQAMFNQIQNASVYKILKDKEIIGDIVIRKRENNNFYLRVISVIPQYQNLGVGQMAIKFIENEFPEASEWELITPFKSYRNHHFYEKMGYVKVEEYRHSAILTMYRYKKKVLS
ncbi:GNAT family N-acetyltransferase [Anaerocolumna sp. AGMB13020]|uniref:GNAT family N-acetyltransferase n=1 Tax=Anaerocolumna sp. AGMB13020 TaxID=3081750 RepID=UPI0029547CCF|nr:GNAT family N-acetyltransferase [Anaerocolumna sp. AGMB13020]WOO35199.1 GNAT family N-acetyltransferase [Anaerocolumna sp. AGMB13020]